MTFQNRRRIAASSMVVVGVIAAICSAVSLSAQAPDDAPKESPKSPAPAVNAATPSEETPAAVGNAPADAPQNPFEDLPAKDGNSEKGASSPEQAVDQDDTEATRDPFSVTDRILDKSTQPEFVRAQRAQVPNLQLRGFATDGVNPPIALLSVDSNDTMVIREGDVITLQLGGRSTVIRVQRVENHSVQVEVGTLGEVIVVR